MVALLVLLTILCLLAIDSLLLSRERHHAVAVATPVPMRADPPPAGVFLDSTHTWLRLEPSGGLRIGLDSFLTEALGDLQRVELPRAGTTVRRGAPLLTLTVAGRTVTVPSPATGRVAAVNGRAAQDPHLVGAEPYGHGWLVSVAPEDLETALSPLRIGQAARRFIEQQVEALSDLLTPAVSVNAVPVMADGALPSRGAAATLDEASWATFREAFLKSGPSSR